MSRVYTFWTIPLGFDQDRADRRGYSKGRRPTISLSEVPLLNRFLTRARDAATGSPALFVAPLLLMLAVGFWLAQPDTASSSGRVASVSTRQSSSPHLWGAGPDSPPPQMDRDEGPDRGFDGPPPDDRRDGPPRGDRRRGGGRHHGPPPFLPPTVIFMIGGALGYLVGTRKRGCCNRQHGLIQMSVPPAPPAPPAT